MAEIQSALSAKFIQVAGANKASHKDVISASPQLASFFGVLKSQLTLSDAGDETTVPDLRAENLLKPLQVLSDVALDAAETTALPSTQPVAGDPALAAAANVVLQQTAIANDAGSLSDSAEPDAIPVKSGNAIGLNSAGQAISEAPGKPLAAAIAADSRQDLPRTDAMRSADAAALPLEMKNSAEAALPSVAPALFGARSDTAANPAISPLHSFEQAMRQVESKTNAAIEAPLRSAAFAPELADKVVWLAGRQGQLADLSLNPPEMGALEVRLTVSGSDASAQFFSPNPLVRDAIDAALPKLRELMAQAGLNLGETEVRDQALGRRDHPEMRSQAAANEAQNAVNQVTMAGIGIVGSAGLGLVDLYI